VLVAGIAVAVVVAAPLAAPNRPGAGGVTISGARSLSDQVSVSYATLDRHRTSDVHLLAFNDLHGNLEAGGNNLYGRFAGGAAYLAKAVKDRQALYGKRRRPSSPATTSAPAPWPTGCSSRSRSPSPPT